MYQHPKNKHAEYHGKITNVVQHDEEWIESRSNVAKDN